MHKLKVIILILAVLLLLISCSSDTISPQEPTVAPPTEVTIVIEPTVAQEEEVAPTVEPKPTAIEEIEPTDAALPTEEPEPEPTEEPVEELVMDNCQTCHNDQEMLTQTADPVEEKEPSESSGVG